MHEFFPKKKYVEELEDTDSYDATSIYDDSENETKSSTRQYKST